MQPGSERRFATETADLSKELNEDLLREVFGFGDVPSHPQAERIYATIMPLIKLLEGFHITFSDLLRQLVIRDARCLSFDCSHLNRAIRGQPERSLSRMKLRLAFAAPPHF